MKINVSRHKLNEQRMKLIWCEKCLRHDSQRIIIFQIGNRILHYASFCVIHQLCILAECIILGSALHSALCISVRLVSSLLRETGKRSALRLLESVQWLHIMHSLWFIYMRRIWLHSHTHLLFNVGLFVWNANPSKTSLNCQWKLSGMQLARRRYFVFIRITTDFFCI